MGNKHNFENIRRLYLQSYNSGLTRGIHKLDFDVEDWHSTLSDVQVAVYKDIKYIGTYLYPIYPIGDYFIDFGNPFKKVGIEILYKEYERQERLECIKYFEKEGWTVYSLESKHVAFTAEELYKRVKGKLGGDFYADEEIDKFIGENKDTNSQCLIYYIKKNHF